MEQHMAQQHFVTHEMPLRVASIMEPRPSVEQPTLPQNPFLQNLLSSNNISHEMPLRAASSRSSGDQAALPQNLFLRKLCPEIIQKATWLAGIDRPVNTKTKYGRSCPLNKSKSALSPSEFDCRKPIGLPPKCLRPVSTKFRTRRDQ